MSLLALLALPRKNSKYMTKSLAGSRVKGIKLIGIVHKLLKAQRSILRKLSTLIFLLITSLESILKSLWIGRIVSLTTQKI